MAYRLSVEPSDVGSEQVGGGSVQTPKVKN